MGKIQEIQDGAGAVTEAVRATGATGDLRLHEFRSRIFRNTRFLRVWVPRDTTPQRMQAGIIRCFI